MSKIARDDNCEGWCCPECGRALEYDGEADWDNWWQWCYCPEHGQADDDEAVACVREAGGA